MDPQSIKFEKAALSVISEGRREQRKLIEHALLQALLESLVTILEKQFLSHFTHRCSLSPVLKKIAVARDKNMSCLEKDRTNILRTVKGLYFDRGISLLGIALK
jgi:hypothetical protein